MAINFVNLVAAQEEAFTNLKIKDNGPANPSSLTRLKQKLAPCGAKLPPIYRQAAFEPFLAVVNSLTTADFAKLEKPSSNLGFAMFDIAQALIQNAAGYEADATGGFEEVVSDLYDGFLSAEDRHNIKLPDHTILPPLVKWGNCEDGPYTVTTDAMASFNMKCAIVNLPPSLARGGLVGWGCLAHEVAGHDISHADNGLLAEMAQAVNTAIKSDAKIKSTNLRNTLASYWSDRVDESASDLMGIMNMGPAAGAVVIPFFRALLGAFGSPQKLRSDGPADDEHPADILRVMLGASGVSLLSFSDHQDWSNAILSEGLKDMTTIILNNHVTVDKVSAQRSADIVAEVITQTQFTKLNGHSLQEIQDWANDDELIVKGLRGALQRNTEPGPDIMDGAYAAHVVAAAVYEALLVKQEVAPLFTRMISLLKNMHDDNPSWGPLFVAHPGDLKRDHIINLRRR